MDIHQVQEYRSRDHAVDQWFSAFLMLPPFSTLSSVVVKHALPNHIIILLLLPNCNFETVIDCNVNTWYTGYLISNPQRVLQVEKCQGRDQESKDIN